MKHMIYITLAIILIGVGLVVFPLPIPFGAPMIAIGCTILLTHSRVATRVLAGARQRWSRVDQTVHFIEIRAPRSIARVLRRTKPVDIKLFRRKI